MISSATSGAQKSPRMFAIQGGHPGELSSLLMAPSVRELVQEMSPLLLLFSWYCHGGQSWNKIPHKTSHTNSTKYSFLRIKAFTIIKWVGLYFKTVHGE